MMNLKSLALATNLYEAGPSLWAGNTEDYEGIYTALCEEPALQE